MSERAKASQGNAVSGRESAVVHPMASAGDGIALAQEPSGHKAFAQAP